MSTPWLFGERPHNVFAQTLPADHLFLAKRLQAAIHLRFGLPPKSPIAIKKLIKVADRACAFFEATQLAGFSHEESVGFFGLPPKDYHLTIHPLPPFEAQARYVQRYHVLAEAAGYAPSPAAFDTE